MGSGKISLAEQIRQAVRHLSPGGFRADDISCAIKVRPYEGRAHVRVAIRDFLKRGEMERVRRGWYRYVPRPQKTTNRQRLWNVIRRMPDCRFSLNDLEQITGIKRESITEFCGWLVSDGHAHRMKRGQFRRVGVFEIGVPPNQKKIDKLRAIRKGGGRK